MSKTEHVLYQLLLCMTILRAKVMSWCTAEPNIENYYGRAGIASCTFLLEGQLCSPIPLLLYLDYNYWTVSVPVLIMHSSGIQSFWQYILMHIIISSMPTHMYVFLNVKLAQRYTWRNGVMDAVKGVKVHNVIIVLSLLVPRLLRGCLLEHTYTYSHGWFSLWI